MLKYLDTKVVFQEVPDEISLCISISNCPGTCEGCHSPWLREDVGDVLSEKAIKQMIEHNKGISCICFMGGDATVESLKGFLKHIRIHYPGLKTAWYSGKDKLEDKNILHYLDYFKLGSYKKGFGPLDSKGTNQRFYKVLHTPVSKAILVDITHKFWRNENSSK